MMLSGESFWPKEPPFCRTVSKVTNLREYTVRPRSVSELLEASAARFPNKIAIVDGVRTLTFNDLKAEIQQVVAFLALECSVGTGDRVALLLPSGIDLVVILLATLNLGGVAVPLNTKLTVYELELQLVNSGASVLFSTDEHLKKLRPILPKTGIRHVIPIDPLMPIWKNHLPKAGISSRQKAYDENSCAVVLYTSGTTGHPRGAMISHNNIIHSMMSYAHTLQLTDRDSTIVAVPLFYVTGLIAQVLLFLYLCGTTILMPRFDADELLRLMNEHSITFFHAVETVYLKILDLPHRRRSQINSLRMLACGGGALMPSTIKALKAWLPRVDIRTVYGLTETSSPATVMPLDISKVPGKMRSCGRPIPVVDCRVVSESGRGLPSNRPGELLLRGSVVVKGYWNNKEATQSTFEDVWLRTGDIACYDDEGFVYILDRAKDTINRGGEKVYSSEVEAVLRDHPDVKEVAVVASPDPLYGETPKAFIVLRPQAIPSVDGLSAFARSRLAKYKIPTEWRFVEELPKNANSKVLKTLLRGECPCRTVIRPWVVS